MNTKTRKEQHILAGLPKLIEDNEVLTITERLREHFMDKNGAVRRGLPVRHLVQSTKAFNRPASEAIFPYVNLAVITKNEYADLAHAMQTAIREGQLDTVEFFLTTKMFTEAALHKQLQASLHSRVDLGDIFAKVFEITGTALSVQIFFGHIHSVLFNERKGELLFYRQFMDGKDFYTRILATAKKDVQTDYRTLVNNILAEITPKEDYRILVDICSEPKFSSHSKKMPFLKTVIENSVLTKATKDLGASKTNRKKM